MRSTTTIIISHDVYGGDFLDKNLNPLCLFFYFLGCGLLYLSYTMSSFWLYIISCIVFILSLHNYKNISNTAFDTSFNEIVNLTK